MMNMEEKIEKMEETVDNKLATRETDDVNSEVVPSVDSDKNSSDWNSRGKISKFRENKRKRPRRKSKKGKHPYSKSSWFQRRDLGSSERAQRVREQMFEHGQPVAPYNTTQFLIEDHGDIQNIDAQLQSNPGSSILGNKPPRARDSSFSIDSDVDYFYSSPEDEEEFLTKEFSNAYEDLHVERLSSMSKSELIHDYLQLESKYEKALAELKRLRKEEDEEGDLSLQENEVEPQEAEDRDGDTDGSSKSENDLAELLRISQIENKSLKVELEELRKEIKTLRNLVEKNDTSSVDSDSDSSSTSSLSSDSSSSGSDLTEEKCPSMNGVIEKNSFTNHNINEEPESSETESTNQQYSALRQDTEN